MAEPVWACSTLAGRRCDRTMGVQTLLFSRRYRAALLDYLLRGDESGLVRAYDLGRGAIADGLGLLEILRAHQRAVHSILESSHDVDEMLRRLTASSEFLMETLSPFEMTSRGYVELLRPSQGSRAKRKTPIDRTFHRITG
jgi:hypothetical protein